MRERPLEPRAALLELLSLALAVGCCWLQGALAVAPQTEQPEPSPRAPIFSADQTVCSGRWVSFLAWAERLECQLPYPVRRASVAGVGGAYPGNIGRQKSVGTHRKAAHLRKDDRADPRRPGNSSLAARFHRSAAPPDAYRASDKLFAPQPAIYPVFV